MAGPRIKKVHIPHWFALGRFREQNRTRTGLSSGVDHVRALHARLFVLCLQLRSGVVIANTSTVRSYIGAEHVLSVEIGSDQPAGIAVRKQMESPQRHHG